MICILYIGCMGVDKFFSRGAILVALWWGSGAMHLQDFFFGKLHALRSILVQSESKFSEIIIIFFHVGASTGI